MLNRLLNGISSQTKGSFSEQCSSLISKASQVAQNGVSQGSSRIEQIFKDSRKESFVSGYQKGLQEGRSIHYAKGFTDGKRIGALLGGSKMFIASLVTYKVGTYFGILGVDHSLSSAEK